MAMRLGANNSVLKTQIATNSCSVRRWREFPTQAISVYQPVVFANLGGDGGVIREIF